MSSLCLYTIEYGLIFRSTFLDETVAILYSLEILMFLIFFTTSFFRNDGPLWKLMAKQNYRFLFWFICNLVTVWWISRLVLRKSKRDSPIPLLETLHWLPVEKRISYKLATICHKCIHGNAPSYLTNILQLYAPSRHLRSSSDSQILVTPRLKLKTIGERSFSFCGPKTWNSLPKDLRETASLDTFKSQLKTFLFKSWKPWRHSWGIVVLVVIHLMHYTVTLSF